VLEKYPKDVKLIVKHFPLETHGYAKKAAIAALAASRQGKFWEMHEKLFASQKDLSDAKVGDIAAELGLKKEQFDKDLLDPAIVSLIERDMNDGTKALVQGTPTIFVNGKVLKQRGLEGFQQAIERELKKTNKN
jgi:protein-disulfide isomerase